MSAGEPGSPCGVALGSRVRRVPDLGGIKVKWKGRAFPPIQML